MSNFEYLYYLLWTELGSLTHIREGLLNLDFEDIFKASHLKTGKAKLNYTDNTICSKKLSVDLMFVVKGFHRKAFISQ